MKNIALIVNGIKDPEKKIAEKVKNIIESNGGICTNCIFTKKVGESEIGTLRLKDIPENTELIISVGGDGTFIHAAKDLVKLNIPILGVNIGHLGYLTEVNLDGFEEEFRHIIDGEYTITDRMMLKGQIIRNGKSVHKDIALNDIVLNRIGSMKIIDYDVYVDGNFLNSYSADGYIICSPTGSTGYNLSSGGPVAHPSAEVIITTPICAHTLNSRSVVFSADVSIEVIVKQRNDEEKQRKAVSFDGENEILLENEDTIRIQKSDLVLKTLRLAKISFIEHLGKKMR